MKKKTLFNFIVLILASILLCSCGVEKAKEDNTETPKLTYIGHASIKVTTKENKVIYVDPAASGDYNEPADIILVTHGHNDHNQVSKVKTKDSTKTILSVNALKDGVYQSFDIDGIKIQAVPAYNSNHPKDQCVGYIIEFDNIKLYHAGDTSNIEEMKDLTDKNITYALFPIDGIYNMGSVEAKEAAKIVNAKHSIPIHTSELGRAFNYDNAKAFCTDKDIIIEPGKSIHLEP